MDPLRHCRCKAAALGLANFPAVPDLVEVLASSGGRVPYLILCEHCLVSSGVEATVPLAAPHFTTGIVR